MVMTIQIFREVGVAKRGRIDDPLLIIHLVHDSSTAFHFQWQLKLRIVSLSLLGSLGDSAISILSGFRMMLMRREAPPYFFGRSTLMKEPA